MLVMAVFFMMILMGFVAMAIDVGLLYEDRRHLQNSADAAALAGVAELPKNPALARTKAAEWAANNGIDSSQIKAINVRSTDALNDTMHVELEQNFGWIFGRVMGQTTDTIAASADAQIGSLAGGHDIVPWAILMGASDCLTLTGEPIINADCSVKVGAGTGITGWYGALDLDGNGGGSAEYQDNITDGTAETTYCSRGQTEPECDTSRVDTLDGNKVGGTDKGIEARLANEPTCDANGNNIDDFSEVFVPDTSGTATYAVACPESPRLIVVPIVTLNGLSASTVTIEGWALAYLRGYGCVGTDCHTGNGHWEVQVTMVDAVYSQSAGYIGAFNPMAAVAVRRLIK